jgi:pimeloyl-CoA synthetase
VFRRGEALASCIRVFCIDALDFLDAIVYCTGVWAGKGGEYTRSFPVKYTGSLEAV